MDAELDMHQHIKSVCASSMGAIRNIGRFRRSIDRKTSEMLINHMVMSRLDYCNILYFNLPMAQLKRLQQIQNICARLVTRSPRRSSISSMFEELHWLPVQKRVLYKVLLSVYKARMTSSAPQYLKEMFRPYTPCRSLRSSSANMLVIPKAQLKAYGGRALKHAAPVVWNSLPHEFRSMAEDDTASFKIKLKTLLFSSSKF